MSLTRPLLEELPAPAIVRRRLGDTLREASLLRRLLRLAERAEQYRALDRRLAVPAPGREVRGEQ